MNIFKAIITLLVLALAQSAANATVDQVKYKIAYNPSTCLYDVFMTVTNGSTTSIMDQEAYPAQVTLVVPTGTTVGTLAIVPNEPRVGTNNGGTLTRSTPKAWTNSNSEINNAALAGYDAYSFIPNLTNAYFGALNTNDVVLLFSIPISTTTCGSGIRLWNNNEIQGSPVAGGDPTSANFGGLDYNNGIDFSSATGIVQAYTGNSTSNATLPKPTVTLTSTHALGVRFDASSTATGGHACAGSLTYAWTGPNSFMSTAPSISVSPLVTSSYGTYVLTVTDEKGCSSAAWQSIAPFTPLPVKLISFEGDADRCNAALRWTTASEVNFERFDVQYSADGRSFQTVGQVSNKRNANGSSYSFNHNQEDQKGYYRLKMIDVGGDYTVSQTVSVTTSCDDKSVITVFPNPTSGNITVTGINSGDHIRVMSMVGQVVSTATATGSSATVDITPYAAGSYNVLVMQGQMVKRTARIVKQ